MAYDIRVICADLSATLYVRAIYRTRDGKVWRPSSSSWVVWDNVAFIADPSIYSIALSPIGGGLFGAPMPAGIASGTEVVIVFCIQAGAAPAVDDLIQGRDSFRWAGTASVSPSGVNTRCWIGVDEVRALPNISATMDDSTLAIVVNGVCGGIERHCKRHFKLAHYKDWIRGRGSRNLWLENRPVVNVDRVSVGKASVGFAMYNRSLYQCSRASIKVSTPWTDAGGYTPDTQAMTCRATENGVTDEFTLAFADYPTLGDLFDAMATHTYWSFNFVDQYRTYPSTDLYPHEHRQCRQYAVYEWLPYDSIAEYKCEAESGMLILERGWFPNSIANVWPEMGRPPRGLSIDNVFPERGWFSLAVTDVFVEYDGGYSDETFPGELKAITLSLAQRMLAAISSDPSIVSHKLGDEAWSKRATMMVDEAIWTTYQKALSAYRSPTV